MPHSMQVFGRVLISFATLGCAMPVAPTAAAQTGDAAVVSRLAAIREKHHLPALGAALITSKGLVTSGVTGTRKAGTTVAATIDDKWHLGSDTKAMTAVIVAKLVEQGKLSWQSTIGDVFADVAGTFPAAFRAITLEQILAHRAGLPPNLNWSQVARTGGSHVNQRLTALKTAAATPLASAPGSKYEYSNLGYTIAGAMAEHVTGEPWEKLMNDMVFRPLGMTSCGYGGVGTEGKIDQPWPHDESGKPEPRNGPLTDNPQVMGPAGTVHCSIADWAKFIADQLRGDLGHGALLKPETYKALHTPQFGGTYAGGWLVASRPWAGGTALTHAGSNTMNFCVVWIAPAKDFAVLAVTNQAGTAGSAGTDEAVGALIQLHTAGNR